MNDNSGWIKIHRSTIDHWIWQDAQKFHWWIELLFMANWEQKKVVVGNTIVTVERGQMVASNSFLMEKWGVCTHTVRNFLRLLEADGMITQTTYPKYNVITICNYDKYQNKEIAKVDPSADLQVTTNADLNADPLTDPNADPNKEYKNIRTKEDIIPPTPQGGEQASLFVDDADEQKAKGKKTSKKFVKPTVEEIDAYCRERNNTIDAESFFNFYESKGWLVGKSPMKDWKAAVRTWEKNRQQAPQSSPQSQSNRYEMIDEQGNRYYLQGYGKHKVIIPADAPPRPSETMFWSNFTKSWYQP